MFELITFKILRYPICILFFFICCEKYEKNTIEEDDFRVFSNELEKDSNSYYHMEIKQNNDENNTTVYARTSSDWIQKVNWYCEEINRDYQITLFPVSSYTDVDGESHTVVYPRSNMVGDTIKVFADYIDENTNLLYTSWISIVLE